MRRLAPACLVYRVQADDGRGPFRPCTTALWTDAVVSAEHAAYVRETALDFLSSDDFQRIWWSELHYAMGCRTLPLLLKWFTEGEQRRLAHLGYHIVCVQADTIVAESAKQLVFGRKRPLAEGAVFLPWPHQSARLCGPAQQVTG